MNWNKNKLHHQSTIKLCYLSTTIGSEHEPLLLGVVNPWQPKAGTQCGAHGQWTGPFSHQCNGKLLHDIASHSVVEQHHQLKYVSCLLADTKGCTKINFFWQKKSSKHTTFSKQLTGWHQAVHNAITYSSSANYQVLEEDSAQTPLWDAIFWDTGIHSIPRGNATYKRTPQSRRGRTRPITRRTGHLTREVTSETTCVGMKNLHSEHFIVPRAQNFHSARSRRLSKSARGTSKLLYHRTQCWIWSGQKSLSFFVSAMPLQIGAGAF